MNFDFNKLNEMNVGDFLSDEEKNQMSEIFNHVGMEDWEYDPSDNSMRLKIKIINNSNNPDPSYQKEGDSGFDFMANLPQDSTIVVEPVRPRSGLALKNGITVLNTPGTVDSGYRGEVMVILFNTGEEPFTIKNGDRIAQGVISPVQTRKTTKFARVNTLDTSDRGAGGFGSTGV
jgi:dUTP pyrophosphatase